MSAAERDDLHTFTPTLESVLGHTEVSAPLKPGGYTTAYEIRDELHQSLAQLKYFNECSVLDFPNYFNVGDHLIWLGLLSWLRHVRQVRINYYSTRRTFSEKDYEKKSSGAPIILTGGGNLGDLWQDHQNFRERIISRYHDRPIIIMPQSICFKGPASLKKAQDIFNAHPDLTLFTRDLVSYQMALQYFPRCRVLKAPDLAFQLADWIASLRMPEPLYPVLLHYRNDQEICGATGKLRLPPLTEGVIEADWPSMEPHAKWRQRIIIKLPFLWRMPSVHEIVKRVPPLWAEPLKRFAHDLSELQHPSIFLRSLDLALQGIGLIKEFRFVVTNRLHGHILSVLLGKPHALLPNSYHKNESFYSTWTQGIPFCSFAHPDVPLPIPKFLRGPDPRQYTSG